MFWGTINLCIDCQNKSTTAAVYFSQACCSGCLILSSMIVAAKSQRDASSIGRVLVRLHLALSETTGQSTDTRMRELPGRTGGWMALSPRSFSWSFLLARVVPLLDFGVRNIRKRKGKQRKACEGQEFQKARSICDFLKPTAVFLSWFCFLSINYLAAMVCGKRQRCSWFHGLNR
jgi:hypothetical protein